MTLFSWNFFIVFMESYSMQNGERSDLSKYEFEVAFGNINVLDL